MTVKENHTILSRATIRAIVITALVAVAAVFSTQNAGVAFGECLYQPNSGDQADLWLNMGGEDTYFTDAEWPNATVKTFSLDGPFRGDVNIWTYRDWGLTTSTTSSDITCTTSTAQWYTVTKNAESMPIYLKRCNWGENTSLQFGITHERKCILNGVQSNIYPMLITDSDMEGTFLTYSTGGEDGTGNRNNQNEPQSPREDLETLWAPTRAAYIEWTVQMRWWAYFGSGDPVRYAELMALQEALDDERLSIEYVWLKKQIRIREDDPEATVTDLQDWGITFVGYNGDATLTDALAELIVQLAVELREERSWEAAFPMRYVEDIHLLVEDETGTTTAMNLAEYLELEYTPKLEEAEPEIPTGPIRIGITSRKPPLNVGQTISYLEAALIGDPKYAGMEVAGISTWEDPVTGAVVRKVTLHGSGGASPPSALPANAPTERTQFMLTGAGPDLQPRMTITPFMSVQIAGDFRYMRMTVAAVSTILEGAIRVILAAPAQR